jgi:hypothetical protein
MITLQIDEGWFLADLTYFSEPIAIADARGELIGRFVPAPRDLAPAIDSTALLDPAGVFEECDLPRIVSSG